MNCSDATLQLAALGDGELGDDDAVTLRAHVATCPRCRAELEALARLRTDIRAEAPRFAAPASLRARVVAGRVAPPTVRAPKRERQRWFAAGAFAGACLAVVTGFATVSFLERRASDDVTLEAVENHVRATLSDHLIAVASSDRHTVKPWLSTRLDYAAPVSERPAPDGFALAGARIDSLDRRPVATLVYRYGNHVVDVFVRPRPNGATARALESVRGFNVVSATAGAMEWRAVADVDATVLAGFVERLAREGAAQAPSPR